MSAGNDWLDGIHACDDAAYGVVQLLNRFKDRDLIEGDATYERLVDGRQNGPAGVCVVNDGNGRPRYLVTVTEIPDKTT